MIFELYRHSDGTVTSVEQQETADGRLSLKEDRTEKWPRLQRTDGNGKICHNPNNGNEKCISFLSVSDFLVLVYMRSQTRTFFGRTALLRNTIAFFESTEGSALINADDADGWNRVRDDIQGFTYANKFTGKNATISNACRRIGDADVFETWLRHENSRFALICNCIDRGFQPLSEEILLSYHAQQACLFTGLFVERYIRVPEWDGLSFRTSGLDSLSALLAAGSRFTLNGEALSGRSTALKLVAKTLCADGSQYLPVYVDLQEVTLQDDYPIRNYIEKIAQANPVPPHGCGTEKKQPVLILDADSSAAIPDRVKDELAHWQETGMKIITTFQLPDYKSCYLSALTDNAVAHYLFGESNRTIHLSPDSPLRELPVLHLYKTMLDNGDSRFLSREVTKWDILDTYFSPVFAGTPVPAVGFYAECINANGSNSKQGKVLPAVSWYISRSGSDIQKRALEGKYLFQWGAVKFLLEAIRTHELCFDPENFTYTDCRPWAELLWYSLQNLPVTDLLQDSFGRGEEYHQFILKCLYSAYYSYIDSARNEDKSKVSRCKRVQNTLYKLFQTEYGYIKAGKTAHRSVFLRLARLCGEVFRRTYQFDKVDRIRTLVLSLFDGDPDAGNYRAFLLGIENNSIKAQRARAVMMFEQQDRIGNRGLHMTTVPKDSPDYAKKRQQLDPSALKQFMNPEDADTLRELLFRCAEDVSELSGKQYDYILVFGSNSIEANCEKLKEAVTAGCLKETGKIILSGRYPVAKEGTGTETEAVRMLRCLNGSKNKLSGIPGNDRIILEEESTNAKENVVNSFRTIQEQPDHTPERAYKILIIAKSFMTARIRLYLDFFCRAMINKADCLGVTEPAGTDILHIGRQDFENAPDSAARVYEEAIRLVKFSQYRTDGYLNDLVLPEETAKTLLNMLNRLKIYPDFFQVRRPGKSEPVPCSLYLPA